jgi:hypothetical protein
MIKSKLDHSARSHTVLFMTLEIEAKEVRGHRCQFSISSEKNLISDPQHALDLNCDDGLSVFQLIGPIDKAASLVSLRVRFPGVRKRLINSPGRQLYRGSLSFLAT